MRNNLSLKVCKLKKKRVRASGEKGMELKHESAKKQQAATLFYYLLFIFFFYMYVYFTHFT